MSPSSYLVLTGFSPSGNCLFSSFLSLLDGNVSTILTVLSIKGDLKAPGTGFLNNGNIQE